MSEYTDGYRAGFVDGYRAGLVGDLAAAQREIKEVVGRVASGSNRSDTAPATAPGKRRASGYNRRFSREYRRIKKAKTLKSGKMAKGYGGRRGHVRIVKEAHKAAKRGQK